MVFLRFPFRNGINQTSFHHGPSVSSKVIYENVAICLGINDFKLFYNGKILPPGETVSQDANIDVIFPLPGGKGGFGSMLRAIGAQIEKTTNREACRDLSGRRLRDINEEQRLKKWISKESERKAEKARRRKERIERLKAKPRHNFNDFEYEKKLSEGPDRVEEALAAGMEKMSKRPASEASCSAVQPKKKHLWLDEEMSSSSDSDPETLGSPKARTSDSCAGSSNEEAGCSSQPQATFQEERKSSNVKSMNENSSSGADTREKSVSDSNETQNKTPAEFFQPSEDSTSSSNQEKISKDLSNDGSTHIEETAVIVSPKENLSINQENSNKDPSSKDSNQEKFIPESVTYLPIDLMSYNDVSELEALGLDRLKAALMEKGLKCGGPLQDRAQRLWKVRGLEPHQYPPKLLAKKK
ncbi:hypothetical protein JTE90_006889 [Oedothorax gibbosus]|uniref:Replication stress response regulator SDE2 n=1 Tax=Oedothorax gibbosus TaxID=931172 RepID=A0AAV6VQW0_9ARAC|nr:hypothetical protein JTE90_006889 [Oedothorax gibbosus]